MRRLHLLCFAWFCALLHRAPLARVVKIQSATLSKPGQPHQKDNLPSSRGVINPVAQFRQPAEVNYSSAKLMACSSKPRRNIPPITLLVELGGIEPPSRTTFLHSSEAQGLTLPSNTNCWGRTSHPPCICLTCLYCMLSFRCSLCQTVGCMRSDSNARCWVQDDPVSLATR